ncbi:MAG: NAAT family transporter [Acidobacteria bacterium]|nr:NAAT family transporter [Acidobacteriota bacterium]
MPLSKVFLVTFTALLTMVNPLAVVPAFVTLTQGIARSLRASVALVAAISCVAVLTIFLLAGNYVFSFFGITVPAFQIMGGIIFLTNSLRTLTDDDRRAYDIGGDKRMEDTDARKAEIDPSSIAVVPLAIPMLSGPGAITTVMVLVNLYPAWEQKIAVIFSIVGVGLVSWIVLLAAVPLSRMMGDRGRAVFAKIMSLLLGAIGIQFIINGIRPIALELMKAS